MKNKTFSITTPAIEWMELADIDMAWFVYPEPYKIEDFENYEE